MSYNIKFDDITSVQVESQKTIPPRSGHVECVSLLVKV